MRDVVETLNDDVWKAVFSKTEKNYDTYKIAKSFHKNYQIVNVVNSARNAAYGSDDLEFT